MDKNQDLINILVSGGTAVIPTDTIYGLVGRALNEKTVKRVYRLKKRNPDKPLIIIISDVSDLNSFGIKINNYQKKFLNNYWPGSVSIALPTEDNKFSYLDRGTRYLAFRLPSDNNLKKLVKLTGPLVAPSANPEGLEPSKNIKMAQNYFGKNVDYYFDGGEDIKPSSTLVLLDRNKFIVLREGAVKIK